LELAFLLSKKSGGNMNFRKRYKAYLQYVKQEKVNSAVRSFKSRAKPGIMLIPMKMLKMRWHLPIFLCFSVLNMINYEFSRSGK